VASDPVPSPSPGESSFQDALGEGRIRGRGAALNPGNRFERVRLHILGEHLDEARAEHPEGVQVRTEILPDGSRSIINPVDSPDLGFRWTLNPYRGCEHGCIYCYARPGHEYLGMSCGLDFETKILAKHDAPDLLRAALRARSWKGETIVMSGVTDPYQPVERELKITRRCLEVLVAHRQPVALVTKSRLILRDLDLLSELANFGAVRVAVSLTTLDSSLAAKMEPRAASPTARLGAIRALAGAGIPVAVMTAPIIPAVNDHEIPALLKAASEAGATSSGWVLLRLPFQIKALFLEWLQRHFPDRAAKVESLMRQAHGGDLYGAQFFDRQRGHGPWAEQLAQTHRVFSERFGLTAARAPLNSDAFRREAPGEPGQMPLFGG
jgi:DNA repair photolyase